MIIAEYQYNHDIINHDYSRPTCMIVIIQSRKQRDTVTRLRDIPFCFCMWPFHHYTTTTSGSDTPPTAICAAVSGNSRTLYRTRHGVVGGLAVPFSVHRVFNTSPTVHTTETKHQLKRLAHLGRVCQLSVCTHLLQGQEQLLVRFSPPWPHALSNIVTS